MYIDTPPSRIVGKHAISSLFDDDGFQLQLYELYSRPDLWTGIPVLKHVTHENKKWNSSMALVQALETDPHVISAPKTWSYLWEDSGPCAVCSVALHTSRSGSGMLWLFLNRSSSLFDGRLASGTISTLLCLWGGGSY